MRRAIVVDLMPLLAAKNAGHAARAELTDEALVERALAGERWAEEAIYRRHAHAVANLAARMLRCRADAEDVLQETFTIALEKLAQVRDPAALRGWLLGVATSRVRRRFRRRKLLDLLGFEREVDDATLDQCAAENTDQSTRSELVRLERVLQGVSFEPRLAWMLRHVDGHTLPEVAAALGCSLATAKRRLADAEVRVRKHVAHDTERGELGNSARDEGDDTDTDSADDVARTTKRGTR